MRLVAACLIARGSRRRRLGWCSIRVRAAGLGLETVGAEGPLSKGAAAPYASGDRQVFVGVGAGASGFSAVDLKRCWDAG